LSLQVQGQPWQHTKTPSQNKEERERKEGRRESAREGGRKEGKKEGRKHWVHTLSEFHFYHM
jgi:hypothetical protein